MKAGKLLLGMMLSTACAGQGAAVPPSTYADLRYGATIQQRLRILRADGRITTAPAVVSLTTAESGEGPLYPTLAIPRLVQMFGFAFAQVQDRFMEKDKLDQLLRDSAAAIAKLREDAVRQRVDPDRLVLLGFGCSAPLLLLLLTDRHYLADAGVPMSAIRGVHILEGDGMDPLIGTPGIPRVPSPRRCIHQLSMPAVQQAAANATARDHLPPIMIQYADDDLAIVEQAQALAAELHAQGNRVFLQKVPRYNGNSQTMIGAVQDAEASQGLLRFLAYAVGDRP